MAITLGGPGEGNKNINKKTATVPAKKPVSNPTSQDIKLAGLSSSLPYIPEEEFAHMAKTDVRRRNVLNVGAADQASGIELLKRGEQARNYMIDWVARRKVQDPEIQKEIDAKKPEKLKNLATTHIEVYKAGPNDGVGGGYNLGRNKVTLDLGFGNSLAGSTAEIHEFRHGADKAGRDGTALTQREIDLLNNNRTPSNQLPMYMQARKGYYLDDSEQTARIQALRKAFNFKPDEVVTPQLLEQRRQQYLKANKGMSQDVEEAMQLFKGDKLINVLNNLSMNQSQKPLPVIGKSGIKLMAEGGIMDAQGKNIDTNQIASHINDLQKQGKLSKTEAKRLQKGVMKINEASAQGVEYQITGDGVFTAKKDGKTIEGQASGLSTNGNFIQRNLEGRKVSKVMSLASGLSQASQAGNQNQPAQNQPASVAQNPVAGSSPGNAQMGNTQPANTQQPQIMQPQLQNPSLDVVANPFSLGKKGYTNPVNNLDTFSANAKNAGGSQPAPEISLGAQNKPAQKPVQKPAQNTSQKKASVASTGKKAAVTPTKTPAQNPVQNQIPVLDLYTEKDAAAEKAATQSAVNQPAQKPVGKLNASAQLKGIVQPKQAVQKPANQPIVNTPSLGQRMNQAVLNNSGKITPAQIAQNDAERQSRIDSEFAASNQHLFEQARAAFSKNPSMKEYRVSHTPNIFGMFNPIEYSIDRSGKYQRVQKKDIGGLAYTPANMSYGSFSLGKPGYVNPINNQDAFITMAKSVGGNALPAQDQQRMISPNYSSMAMQQTDPMGQGLKQGTGLRLLNAGLGIAGAISYATAKRPNLPGPGKFQSLIMPAQGMSEASKRFAQNQIASQSAQLTNPATSDPRLNAQIKLQANYNANQALSNLAVQDAEMMRQDQYRVNQQLNQDALMNFQNEQAYKQQKFALDNDAYQQRRQQGQAMAQSAINYENQRAADMQNKRIAENNANQQLGILSEQAILSDNANRRINYQPQLTPEQEAAMRQRYGIYQTNNYQKPMRFRLGGMMSKNC